MNIHEKSSYSKPRPQSADCTLNKMATTTESGANGGASGQPLSRRERAYLGQLPDDFLRVAPSHSGGHHRAHQQGRYALYGPVNMTFAS